MTRHHLIAWPVGIAAILALVAVFALGHYITQRNLPELAVQPAPGMTLTETAAQGRMDFPTFDPVEHAKEDAKMSDFIAYHPKGPFGGPSRRGHRMPNHRPSQ